jgi:NAD+ kinase
VKLQKVLVLHKKSTFQLQAIEHREIRFVKLLEQGHPVVTRVKLAHSEHEDSLKRLGDELSRRNIEYKILARSELSAPVSDVDLLISVGGDGTFLDASHYLDSVPILGINSSGSSSFGHLCSANEKTLSKILDDIEADRMRPHKLMRLALYLNGELLPVLILNELLVSHSNPAATSRYFIQLRGDREEQRSSGIWIGPATGSTGSIRSAGGEVMPITDTQFQYLVREPCIRPHENWKLTKGILAADESVTIISQMRTGAIFVDGTHIDYQFYLGDELTVKASPKNLNAFVYADVNDVFIERGSKC